MASEVHDILISRRPQVQMELAPSIEASVRQSIAILLATPVGSVVHRPEYGCRIHSLVHQPLDATRLSLAEFYIEAAIAEFEPRVGDLMVTLREEDQSDPDGPVSQFRIRLEYRLRTPRRTGPARTDSNAIVLWQEVRV